MKAIPFQEQNTMFTKPKWMSDEECGSLHTYKGEGQIISCWELEAGDVERLKKDGKVWLIVAGDVHPPVCLTTEKPFVSEEGDSNGNG